MRLNDEDLRKLIKEKSQYYFGEERKHLKRVVNLAIKKCGIYENFQKIEIESLANEVFLETCGTFDPEKGDRCDSIDKKFHKFFQNNIIRRTKSYLEHEGADKRKLKIKMRDANGDYILDENGNVKKNVLENISLDTPVGDEDDNCFLRDIIEDKRNFYSLIEEASNKDALNSFLCKLSLLQKDIVMLIMEGYTQAEIQEILKISTKRYVTEWNDICSFENTVPLLRMI